MSIISLDDLVKGSGFLVKGSSVCGRTKTWDYAARRISEDLELLTVAADETSG